MKRLGRLNPWGNYLGFAVFGILVVSLMQYSTQANAMAPTQAFSADQHSGFINQNDAYDWSGNWTSYHVLRSGYIDEDPLTITGGSGGAYTSTTFLCEIVYYPSDVEVDDTGTRSFWVEGNTFRIHMDTYYNGIHAVTCDAYLNRTANPDQLAGKIVEIFTHELRTDDWPVQVLELSNPAVYKESLCAARNGAGMPEPCGAESSSGPGPVIPPPSVPTLAPAPPAAGPSSNASFDISIGCNDRATSKENIACSMNIVPDEQLAGTAFSIIWLVDGVVAGEDGGAITTDAIAVRPLPPGSHEITVNVISISTGKTKSASTVTVVSAPGEEAVIPPVEEEAAPPPDEEAFPPPDNSDTTSIPMDWNMVSPIGQAAAAVTTTVLVAAWLFMESQSATQGSRGSQPPRSSSNSIVDIAMQGTDSIFPSEAGDRLAQHTSFLLDSLEGPPAPVHGGDQAGTPTPAEDKPGSAYNGPIAGIESEVFSDNDAYLIMQALQLVPTELLPTDHLFEVTRGDLENLLGAHSDGRPHQVTLPNGNTVIVYEVRGIAFDDLQHDDASDTNTIDFTRGFSIAVNVVKPGTSVTTPDSPAITPDGDAAETRTPEKDEAELNRFFGDEGGSGSQDQEPGGSGSQDQEPGGDTSGGGDSRVFEEDAGDSDIQLEEAGEGDLVDDESADNLEGDAGRPQSDGDSELNDRIDALLDDIKSRTEGRPEPPDLAGGGEEGGSDAGIIDDDESRSATEGF